MSSNGSSNLYPSIDLPMLKTVLYEKITLVLALIALSSLLAVSLSFFLKSDYRATSLLNKPTTALYQGLYLNTGSRKSPYTLFQIFLTKLADKQNFHRFAQQSDLVEKNADLRARVILINKTKDLFNKERNEVEAELTIFSPVLAPNIDLNKAYIQYTNKEILNELVKNQQDKFAITIKKLEQKNQLQTDRIKEQLLFKIEKLKDQILRSKQDSHKLLQLKEELESEQYDLQTLLLENKAADKDFLKNKIELQHLKNLTFDISNISAYQISSSSEVINNKPKKSLIILLSFSFGLILATISISLAVRKSIQRRLATLLPA